MDRDRNLLFGVLAIRLKQVTPAQLVQAAAVWATGQTRDLAEYLLESSALTESDAAFVHDVVAGAVRKHDGDAGASLAALGGDEIVHHSFRGSIALFDSGEVSSVGEATILIDLDDPDSVPAVHEAPGRYTGEREEARGGMGRVLLVHDEHLGRDIALKELLPELDPSPDYSPKPSPVRASVPLVAGFLQEAKITGQLEHPAIVPVYELGHRKDGSLYYTMKLVRGQSLAKAIKEAGPLRERLELLPHFVDLCQAIAYAHSRNCIHRDIKPANVMVGEFGETVVIDWGLAKTKDNEDVHAEGFAETLRVINMGDETVNIGGVWIMENDDRESISAHEKSLNLRTALLVTDPDNPLILWEVAQSYAAVGMHYCKLGDTSRAITNYEQAFDFFSKRRERYPSWDQPSNEYNGAFLLLGVYRKIGDEEKALQVQERYAQVHKKVTAARPRDVQAHRDAAHGYAGRAIRNAGGVASTVKRASATPVGG